MAKRKLRFRLVTRGVRLRKDLGMLGAATILFAVALGGSFANRIFADVRASMREARLERANTLLTAELKDLRHQVDELGASLEGLAARDEQYRLLAGLDPIDPDVRRVGIGGPGTATLETNPLWDVNREAAVRSHEAAVRIDEMLRRARLLSFSWREASTALERAHDKLAATPSILPTDGDITSGFTNNRWHPILGVSRPHFGLDIVAPTGTAIVAAAAGRVTFVGYRGAYGNMIEVDHGYGTITRYAHASRILARRGQTVQRGDTIGRVGATGLAVAPHLHYEVLVDGQFANPRRYLFTTENGPD